MSIADVTKTTLQRLGLDLRRYRPVARRRSALMTALGVRSVLDVGANEGQYGTELRAHGFTGTILSFEPLSSAYAALLRTASGDGDWHCLQYAASDRSGSSRIHVAANSASSSLLVMAPAHTEAAPDTANIGEEPVQLCRLDAVDRLLHADAPFMLKLDVQGHEAAAFAGAAGILDRIVLIEAELSVCELYEGAPLLAEMLGILAERGFELVALEPGFHDPRDGRILQFDGYFRRAGAGS